MTYNSASQRLTMDVFVNAFGRQWGGLAIMPCTTRQSKTLEVSTVKWWNGHEFFVYIHYDTKVVWIWFDGNSRKCETVDQWVAAVEEATAFYDSKQARVLDANTVHGE